MKRKWISALVLSVLMAANVYAAENIGVFSTGNGTITTSPGSLTTSGPGLDVTLEGTVFTEVPADIITVLMPIQVYFNVLPDEESWNKVLSPVINVSNMSSSDVRISVTKAVAEGAELTVENPVGKSVRLGIAPENQIDESLLSSTYLLRSNLSDSTYINLGLLGHAPHNNVAHLKVFGDTPSGVWTSGDVFSVKTIFKVSM